VGLATALTESVPMKAIFNIVAAAVLLLVAPGPVFALWEIASVTRGRAKELGMEVRSTAAGPDDVAVALEFKPEGALKGFSRVDLRVGEGDKSPVTAPPREDRSKPGRTGPRLSRVARPGRPKAPPPADG
jgi:hypothetical protein